MRARFMTVLSLVKAWIALWRLALSGDETVRMDHEIAHDGYPPISDQLPQSTQAEPAQRPPRKRRSERLEETPFWQFRSGILDRLDEYFYCMRQLKRHDKNAYDLFARIGFTVPADRYYNGHNDDNKRRFAATTRRSFGGMLFGTSGSERELAQIEVLPSFMYFTKLRAPAGIQFTKGEIYSFSALYNDRDRAKTGFAAVCTCHVAIDGNGTPRLLKELVNSVSHITPLKTRRGRTRKGAAVTIRSRDWAYPRWTVDGAANHHETPNEWITGLFLMCFITCDECQNKIIVRTKHGGITSAFGIDVKRAKYFFSDREATALAADGKRKRIFHSVIAHDRVLDDSRTVTVKYHYRGIRHFGWNGYQVGIVLPKFNEILKFPKAASYEQDVKDDERAEMASATEVARKFDEALSV